MLSVKVNEKNINSKTVIKGKTEIFEDIKYPQFDFQDGKQKKTAEKMNAFYEKTAKKYSRFIRTELVEKVKSGRVKYNGNAHIGMKYIVCDCGKNAVGVVLDLNFCDERDEKGRRFSQLWQKKDGEMLEISDVLDLNLKNKKLLRNMVFSVAERTIEKNSGKYFENAIFAVRKNFCFNNYFMTPSGIAFYFDAGELRKSKYGAVCFVIKYEKLAKMLKSEFKDLCLS